MEINASHTCPQLLISRQALLHNLSLIRSQLAPGTKICAMVKADAYGHGANLVVDTLCNFSFDDVQPPHIDMLGVSSLEEAAAMGDIDVPILIFRAIENVYVGNHREQIEHAIRAGHILTIGSPAVADDIARLAIQLHSRAKIHVMLDTGMRRCGCEIDSLPELLEKIDSHPSLRLISIGSHFATSDSPNDSFVAEQTARFRAATESFIAPKKFLRHLANSGGIFFASDSHFDMVRPGLSLYGIDPTCRPNFHRNLKPIAKWTAPLLSILLAKKGESVGYGRSWIAPRDTRIGLVPVGYADGYCRAFGNRGVMLIQGKIVPVVGRVSMDLTTVDLHDVPAAQIGEEVVVMDSDPLSPASVYALAEWSGTIPYEVFTRIGPRVIRAAQQQAIKQVSYAE